MRIFLKIIIAINLIALVITIAMQAFTNVYHFSPSRQFSGETIVNPYQGIDSAKWRKANFHAHQRWLVGLDYNYTGEEFIEAYRKQDYDIVGLADHQQINPYGHIPSYEHGMGMNNFHLLMLGADKVSWFNYPIMALPEHQMQYMLDKLKPRAKLLGINHTSRARFSSVDVFENIMGYDMMEMTPDLDPTAWDIALSNGIHSTLIANDDSHTITNRARAFQHTFTMLNTPSLAEDDIISALKQGRAYGVSVSSLRNQTEHPHVGLPVLRSIALLSDTIRVEFDTRADSVLFIGQDAKILARVVPTDSLHSAS